MAGRTEIDVIETIVAYRDEGRIKEYGPDCGPHGGCGWTSEWIARTYGWHENGGCYLPGDGRHICHMWNDLPDGRILDATADQFGGESTVRITSGNDPRYDSQCDCGGIDG